MKHISSDEVLNNVKKASLYYQEVMTYLFNHKALEMPTGFIDGEFTNKIATKVTEQFFEHPEKFTDINSKYTSDIQKLVANSMSRFFGGKEEKKEETKDRRFKDPAWQQSIYFDFIKQYYLLSSDWFKQVVGQYELDPQAKRYLEFTAQQFIDAMSPSNFIFSNPEVIRESLESGMENIARGMKNFLEDIKNSGGVLNVSMTDKSYFQLGKNVAATKGKVIFQNDLIQLICYEPKEKTYSIPIFILPPWINKYYILDLSEKNSLVKWLVDNNYQVFLVSWINPDSTLRHKQFEDYLKEGVVEPLEYIKKLGINKVNAVGYCIGGTLLAIALAYLKEHKDDVINSATFFTTLLDYANPGEIGALINEFSIDAIEAEVEKRGYLDGKYLSNSFSLIRANDLFWSFFVNNYLLGKSPAAFDILYWNSDATNLPAKMYIYYLKNMYINNNLIKPGALEMLGTKIDLSKIDTPSFSLAAQGDHIALWQSVYDGCKVLGGDKTFCLTEAGHVAGVVNPESNKKYAHSISDNLSVSYDEYLKLAKNHSGSWWNSWKNWLMLRSGELGKPINYTALKELEPAPGSYVKKTYSKMNV